jgi:hypothetical protein
MAAGIFFGDSLLGEEDSTVDGTITGILSATAVVGGGWGAREILLFNVSSFTPFFVWPLVWVEKGFSGTYPFSPSSVFEGTAGGTEGWVLGAV